MDDATGYLARFEINGELGSTVFNLERLKRRRRCPGFRTINTTDPVHPFAGHRRPGGHIISWEHGHVHRVRGLWEGIANGTQPAPSFEDGFTCEAVLDAAERSAASGRWEQPVPLPEQDERAQGFDGRPAGLPSSLAD